MDRLDRKVEAWYNIKRSKYNIAVYCGDGKRRTRERPFFFCARKRVYDHGREGELQ